jgi:hypothetical protein
MPAEAFFALKHDILAILVESENSMKRLHPFTIANTRVFWYVMPRGLLVSTKSTSCLRLDIWVRELTCPENGTSTFPYNGPGTVVGIATTYGLDGPGIESRWGGEIFRTCEDRPWGPSSLLYNGYRVLPGGKERPGRDADPSTPSRAVVMKG